MAMLRSPPRLFSALLGAFLAVISAASLADTRSRQFMVFVRVLPQCRLSMPSADLPRTAMLGISCTRDTGYSISFTRGVASQDNAHTVNGVGSGAGQRISLYMPAAPQSAANAQSTAPVFLTISY
jgi:hypothetical protein